jgi:hypothetical protein
MKHWTPRNHVARPPFFWLGDKLYIDLLYDHELEVGFTDMQRLLVAVPPEALLLARRLDGAELRAVMRDLGDAHADIYARLVPSDAVRWQPPKKKGMGR